MWIIIFNIKPYTIQISLKSNLIQGYSHYEIVDNPISINTLDCKKNMGEYMEIVEVKIEGDKCLSSKIMWAQKIQRPLMCG